ncbi:MAG TPA: LapA family protein [Acidimicrobiales bacterium]|nr:LapA family protein [Acidimicrobiales bacterium]
MTDPMSTDGGELRPPRDRRRDARLVMTGIAAVLLVWFALANLTKVSITFWVSTARAPLIVVILISGALGAAVALLISRSRRRRRDEPPA